MVSDLGFAEAVWGLEVSRVYNGLDDTVGPLGRGWSMSGHTWLSEDVDGTVWLHEADGRVVAFTPSGEGYTRPEEVFGELRRDPDTSLRLDHFDGSTDDFDATGLLAERRRWDGQAVRFAHDGDGRVVGANHTSGASVSFAYDGDRLASATAGDGRSVLRLAPDRNLRFLSGWGVVLVE